MKGSPKRPAVALAVAFGLIAYWRKNKTLLVIAAVTAGICFPVALVGACGLILFPPLFGRLVAIPAKDTGLRCSPRLL